MKLTSSISSSSVIATITTIGSILLLLNVAGVVSAAEVVEYDKSTCDPGPHDVSNPSPEADEVSPDLWYFVIPTTVNDGVDVDIDNDAVDDVDVDDNGMIIILVNRTWAPIGADRFYSLVKDNYYNCAAFFRVLPDFIIQWGIASDPDETNKWSTSIQDDPKLTGISNTVGTVSYAKTSSPNTRTTQVFVNYVDNSFLDNQGFVPFGKVVKGMDILTTKTGTGTTGTTGGMYEPNPVPDQSTYRMNGNEWILENYPDIDIIKGSKFSSVLESSSAISSGVTSNITNDDNNETMMYDDDDIFNFNETLSASSEIIGSLDNIMEFTVIFTGGSGDDTTINLTASESAGNAVTAITSSKTMYYYYGTTVTFFFFFIVIF